MKYIIMCGGTYADWQQPRHLTEINGEPIVARTIRLLREQGVTDISISSNSKIFEQFGVPVLEHKNNYNTGDMSAGYWFEAFYPTDEPVCYVFGDVIFSRAAIKKIVETEAADYMFFGSAPPFTRQYHKKWAEPFALKVYDLEGFQEALKLIRFLAEKGFFKRSPIMWELWQVLKGTPLNIINYKNYTVINDYTCDIDYPSEIEIFKNVID